jgi:hypothetical protein
MRQGQFGQADKHGLTNGFRDDDAGLSATHDEGRRHSRPFVFLRAVSPSALEIPDCARAQACPGAFPSNFLTNPCSEVHSNGTENTGMRL